MKYRVCLIYIASLFEENGSIQQQMSCSWWGRAGGWWEDFFFACMEEIAMKCHRCGGIMVLERFYGASDHFSGWRCVLCGEIIDPVIFENRLRQKR